MFNSYNKEYFDLMPGKKTNVCIEYVLGGFYSMGKISNTEGVGLCFV